MSPIDIVLVPGYWEGPTIFDLVTHALERDGYEVFNAPLPSTGQLPGSRNTLYADAASIREVIKSRVELGKEVLQLSKKARVELGEKGGVAKFAFIAGALFPQGHVHGPAPFFDVQGDKLWCKDARHYLFNDLPDDEAEIEVGKLSFQPGFAWDGIIENCGWTEIPSGYLICENDQCIPAEIQGQIARLCHSDLVEKCQAGHCAPRTQPDATIEFIKKVMYSIS